jgi:methionyl aminopeptidase
MVYLKTEEEVELIRESSLLVGKTLAEVAKHVQPGVTPLYLDQLAEAFIRDHGAEPGFKGFNGYEYTLCTSVNEQVVHGIPTEEPLQEGDIISVDCGVKKNGFYGDVAYTFPVGTISEEVRQLLDTTKASLAAAIEVAIAGNRIGDIGHAVQTVAEAQGFSVVRELVGHGLGKNMHEAPEVPNYGRRGNGMKLKEGLVLAIEPMINLGKRNVKQKEDGWTIVTADGKPSAHYEHNIVVRKDKAEVLSTHAWVEEVLLEKVN